MLSAEAVIK